jgi:hypothetical protein
MKSGPKMERHTAFIVFPISIMALGVLFGPFSASIWQTGQRIAHLAGFSSALTTSYVCSPHQYTIELLSFDPLIIYINDFLKEDEVDYILRAR